MRLDPGRSCKVLAGNPSVTIQNPTGQVAYCEVTGEGIHINVAVIPNTIRIEGIDKDPVMVTNKGPVAVILDVSPCVVRGDRRVG